MGKIYGGVEGIPEPDSSITDFEVYLKKCDEYVDKVKAYAKKNGKGKEAGKEINFGLADGIARYIVLSLRPVKLIHLNVLDGYRFQYANRLTAEDVKKQIERQEALAELFKKK